MRHAAAAVDMGFDAAAAAAAYTDYWYLQVFVEMSFFIYFFYQFRNKKVQCYFKSIGILISYLRGWCG